MKHGFARLASRTLVLFMLALLVATCIAPVSAYAKDYSMGPVNIQSQVTPDAGFRVAEERTFEFDGDYTFVYWEFKKSDGASYQISSVEEIVDGSQVPYTQTTDPNAPDSRPVGTYYVEDSGDSTKISVYFRKEDTSATFRLSYSVTGGVKRYQDTGELYWQAIGAEWGATTKNITVEAQLPVSAGETVTPGENVKAWAHGPLNGNVSIQENGVVKLDVPRVDSGTYVEMRALFPQEWLADASVIPQDHLQTALDEEAKWAEEANAQRRQAQLIDRGFIVGTGILGAAALIFAVFAFFKWGREYKPTFDGQYLREVPDDIHPAVAGALWGWGSVGEKEFTATLMDLSVKRVVSLQPVTYETKGTFGRTKEHEDYLLTLDREKAAGVTDPIDRGVIDLLFGTVAGGADSLYFESIKAYGKEHPEKFSDAMNDWKAEVKAIPAARGYFESTGTALMVGLFTLAFITAGIGFFGTIITGDVFPVIVGVGCAIPVGAIATQMRRRSPEANELHAKLTALKNYLTNFSKLDEAPPMHVILWEKFLVFAVVFGISKQVIEQLEVRMPELVQDPGFIPIYFWMMPHGSLSAPSEAFSGTMLSTSQIAHSQMSSASGGGGGFSMGGGGGFGGGGGGAG